MPAHYETDTTFGHEGLLPLPLPDGWPAMPVPGGPLLVEGKVIVCSRSDTEVRLLRLDESGALDTTFGQQGHLKVKVTADAAHLARLADGRLLLTTLSVLGQGHAGELTVRLLTGDGGCVDTFGHGGQARLNVGPVGNLPALRASTLSAQADDDGFIIGLSCRPATRAHWQALVVRLSGTGQPQFALNGNANHFQYPGMHSVLTDMAVLADGKVLVCGVRWADGDGRRHGFLARLGRDCQLDTAYGQDGFAELRGIRRDSVFARIGPALENGVRWLVGVSAAGGARGSLLTVVALDKAGNPQPGYAGLLPVACSTLQVEAIQVAADGHAQVIGRDTSSVPGKGTFIARLMPDGRFDGRWGHGAAIQWLPAARPQAPSVQADGSLLLLATDRPGEPTLRLLRANSRPTVAARPRLPSDGELDPGWGDAGSAQLSDFYFLPLVSLQPVAEDQAVTVAAAFANVAHLQRWTSQGLPDNSLGDGHAILVELQVDDETSLTLGDLITLPDQRILVMAHAANGNDFAHPLVARLLPDGTSDQSFGDKGTCLITEIDTLDRSGQAGWYGTPPTPQAIVLADDSVVLVFTNPRDANAIDQLMVIKLTAEGRLDDDFGEEGICALRYQNRPTFSVAIALQDDGRILVAGSVDGRALFCRLHPDGTLDESFGEQGFTVIDGGNQGAGQLQGAVTGPQGMLVRLLADGSLHPSFGDGGLIFTPKGQDEPFEEAGSHALQQDGKILLIVNSAAQQIRLRRYLPNAPVPAPRAAWQGFARWLRRHWSRVSKVS